MKKIIFTILTLMVCAAFSSGTAHALYTDDTGTTGQKKFYLDVYGQFGWDHDGDARVNSQLFEADLYTGLHDRVDLIVAFPLYWQQTRENGIATSNIGGYTDMTVDLKWRFLETTNLSLAIKPGLILPTGNRSKGLGTDRMGYGSMLISTFEIKPLAVHANFGFVHKEYVEEDLPGTRKDKIKLALGVVYGISDTLKLKSEIVSMSNTDSTSNVWPTFMTAQAAYDLNNTISVNAAIRWGLNTPATDIMAISGFSVLFP